MTIQLTFDEAQRTLRGDVDTDGIVTAMDALLCVRCAIGLSELTDAQRLAADVNGDGEITSADASLILRYLVGLSKFNNN